MKFLKATVRTTMTVLLALSVSVASAKTGEQANFDWSSLFFQPTTQQQQQQAPQGLLSYLLGDTTGTQQQNGANVMNALTALFSPKAEQTPAPAQQTTVWDALVNAWKGSPAPAQTTAPAQQGAVASALTDLFKQNASGALPVEQDKEMTEQEKRAIFKKSQEMSANFLKKLGLPVPEYTPEQEEQLFQQANALYEQLNKVFKGNAATQ